MSTSAVELVGLSKSFGDVDRGRPRRPADRERRVLLDARPERLGQDDRAADDRRLRAAHRRPGPARRRGRHRPTPVRPRRQHGLPGLCAVPAHGRARQRRVRAAGQEGAQGPATRARDGRPGVGPARPVRRSAPDPALRRAAAAGGPGAGAGQPAHGAAPGRAPRRARPQAAPRDAARAQGAPARGRHHLRVRHARPGGGADDERPHRGLQRRTGGAGRDPVGALRGPRHGLRRRVRRHLEPAGRQRRAGLSSVGREPSASGRRRSTSTPRSSPDRRPRGAR